MKSLLSRRECFAFTANACAPRENVRLTRQHSLSAHEPAASDLFAKLPPIPTRAPVVR
jgi:hypothetical protein